MTLPVLYVLNPNSLQSVTNSVAQSLAPWRALPLEIDCRTSEDGPPGIVSDSDFETCVPPLLQLAQSLRSRASAYVVACFSDPALHILRQEQRRPVFGICESGLLTACTLGRRIGVIAISDQAISRHRRYYEILGLTARIAGERALNVSVAEGAESHRILPHLLEVGSRLRDVDGADVLVLGCASLGQMRGPLEQALGVPVVDPCTAAIAIAAGIVLGH